jgi:hypothetical protein
MKRISAWTLVMSVIFTVLAVSVAPASATVVATQLRPYGLVNHCLDGYLSHGPTQLYVNTSCGATNRFQQWIWNNDPAIHTPIRSVAEDKCVAQSGTDVQFVGCLSPVPSIQRWDFNRITGSNFFYIKKAGTNLCLTRFSLNVGLKTCDSSPSRTIQLWAPV